MALSLILGMMTSSFAAGLSPNYMIQSEGTMSFQQAQSPGFSLQGLGSFSSSQGSSPGFQSGAPIAICGNGLREGAEQCDGNDFDGLTCSSSGFNSGVPSCSANCQILTSTCSNSSGRSVRREELAEIQQPVRSSDIVGESNGESVGEKAAAYASADEPEPVLDQVLAQPAALSSIQSESRSKLRSRLSQKTQTELQSQPQSEPSVVSLPEFQAPQALDTPVSQPQRIFETQVSISPLAASLPHTWLDPSVLVGEQDLREGTTSPDQVSELATDEYQRTLMMVALPADLEQMLANKGAAIKVMAVALAILFTTVALLVLWRELRRVGHVRKIFRHGILLVVAAVLSLLLFFRQQVFAQENTTPGTMPYTMTLTDSQGNPLSMSHSIRFSLWSSADWTATDVSPDGSLNQAAVSYGGWSEEYTVTPGVGGVLSFLLGSLTPLPDLDSSVHRYLQIEVRATADPLTSYQLMDPSADAGADLVDRQQLGSLPYAENANRVDNREVGTAEGELAVLGSGGRWSVSQIPSGTDQEVFTLDANDTMEAAGAGTIRLQFGSSLLRFLEYDLTDGLFRLNDDLDIQGNLTVSGSINGVAAVVGEAESQTLTNKTLDGDDNTVQDLEWSSLKTRVRSISFVPEYSGAVLVPDGSDNLIDVTVGTEGAGQISHFYRFDSSQVVLQDLDLRLKLLIPDDFVDFSNDSDLTFSYRSTGASSAEAHIDIIPFDEDGDPAYDPIEGQNLTSPDWTSLINEFDGVSFNPQPGEYIELLVRGFASSLGSSYVGEIILRYTAR
ncbi:MAG: hypothetical protein Q8P95_03515 [bacterium]|nr:hypothetical protein [bacterium]